MEDKLICPVCMKEFIRTEQHCYILNKEYTCSWDCFISYIKAHPKTKKLAVTEPAVLEVKQLTPEIKQTLEKLVLFNVPESVRKRGRPRKNS